MSQLHELEIFQGPQFLGFVRNIPPPPPFAGAVWLPDRTVFDLEVEYVLGAQSNPVMANVMAWDSEAPIGGRPGLGRRMMMELPPIKRKVKIAEKQLIRFLTPRAGSRDRQDAIDAVFDDTARLIDGIHARVEWMRVQALSEDTLSYEQDGIVFEIDYEIDDDLQFDVGVDGDLSTWWGDTANSNPIDDLMKMAQTYEDKTGFTLARLVLSRSILPFLLQNEAIHAMVFGSNGPGRQVLPGELELLLDQFGLPSIVTYDARVYEEQEDGSVSTLRPLDPKKAFFLPEDSVFIGETLWGPTAESRALIGTPMASQAPGIFAIVYGKEDPPSEWIKAAAVAVPSLPGADKLSQVQLLNPA